MQTFKNFREDQSEVIGEISFMDRMKKAKAMSIQAKKPSNIKKKQRNNENYDHVPLNSEFHLIDSDGTYGFLKDKGVL